MIWKKNLDLRKEIQGNANHYETLECENEKAHRRQKRQNKYKNTKFSFHIFFFQ